MSGVIVPAPRSAGRIADTALVLSWFAKTMKDSALLSLMTQYTPVEANPRTKDMQAFENRLLTNSEDSALRNLLSELEIDNGFYQELIEDPIGFPTLHAYKHSPPNSQNRFGIGGRGGYRKRFEFVRSCS
ncbi:hypothetical protein [Treponema phagedenis]|uniref:hypothetical protein n=1 Tax=Treponema phagedenis TaxID=162 RepID=UPI0020912C55|nr:hypothetical protein [Treponema phagedenis]